MLSNIIFTCTTLISCILAILISITIFFILILHIKEKHDVPLLLTANTYIAMVVFSIVVLSENIFVLKMDLYGLTSISVKDWTGCGFLRFLTYERYGCFYMSFVLQALYRLTRVVYTKYKFLQVCKFQEKFSPGVIGPLK